MEDSVKEIIESSQYFKNVCEELQKIADIDISQDQVLLFLFLYFLTLPIMEDIHGDLKKTIKHSNKLEQSLFLLETDILSKSGIVENFIKSAVKNREYYSKKILAIEELYISSADKLMAKMFIFDEFYLSLVKKISKADQQKLGVVFTPREIVDGMISLVDEISMRHFDQPLEDFNQLENDMSFMDGFVGSGAFVLGLLFREKNNIESFETLYNDKLKANEILPFTFYICFLNLTHLYKIVTGDIIFPTWLRLTDTFLEYEYEL